MAGEAWVRVPQQVSFPGELACSRHQGTRRESRRWYRRLIKEERVRDVDANAACPRDKVTLRVFLTAVCRRVACRSEAARRGVR